MACQSRQNRSKHQPRHRWAAPNRLRRSGARLAGELKMSARASTLTSLRPGLPFIPRMMFYGSMVPDSVMSLKTLKEGPKLLLARLYKFAGDEDHCNPALPTLAGALVRYLGRQSRSVAEGPREGWLHPNSSPRPKGSGEIPSLALRPFGVAPAGDDGRQPT